MRAEEELGRLLKGEGATVAVAESCTGGLLGASITSEAGSSAWFAGGVIAYSNQVKTHLLGVGQDVMRREGAVSESVARSMAEGARERFCADYGIGLTGIAGPSGGSQDKPVGLVYIGVATPRRDTVVREFRFAGDREAVRRAACESALAILIELMISSSSGS